jgi:hypothetical protein
VSRAELLQALDDTLAAVRRLQGAGITTRAGAPVTGELARLAAELAECRAAVAAGGSLDPAWARATVRWVAGWLPDHELPLLARLGGVIRAAAE